MTKQEAIQMMIKGKKVTHRYFSPNEWITVDKGKFLFEDGVKCSFNEFWADRRQQFWETDWEIFTGN